MVCIFLGGGRAPTGFNCSQVVLQHQQHRQAGLALGLLKATFTLEELQNAWHALRHTSLKLLQSGPCPADTES